MSETETLFAALRQSSDEAVVDMLERMVRDAPDHALNKMNALDLAGTQGIDEERVIAALLNAVGLGMFEMTWNVMCPSCAGVLSANKSLKTLDRAQYHCAFCAAGYETTLDNLVEVTFTVSPRVRKIAAHNPGRTVRGRILSPDLLEFGDRSSGRSGEAAGRRHARNRRLAGRRAGHPFPAGAAGHVDRVRSRDACGPVPGGQRRRDQRAPEPVGDLQQDPGSGRHR